MYFELCTWWALWRTPVVLSRDRIVFCDFVNEWPTIRMTFHTVIQINLFFQLALLCYIANRISMISECIPWNIHIVLFCFVLLWLRHGCLVDLCDAFIQILQGCFTGTGAILWLPQCQWSNPEGCGLKWLVQNHNKTHQSANRIHNACMSLRVYCSHYADVIMIEIASQITSLTVVYSIVNSGAGQSKHQSPASLAFVWGIHRDRWIPRTKDQ